MRLKSDSFKRQLISYVILLLLPITIIALLYGQIIEATTQLCMESCQNTLVSAQSEFDSLIAAFDKLSVNIALHSGFKKLLANPAASESMIATYNIWQFCAEQRDNLYIPSALEYDYQILCRQGEIIFWHSSVSYGLESFFHNAVYYPALNYDSWEETLFGSISRRLLPVQTVTVNGSAAQMLTYLFPVVDNTREKQVNAAIVFQVPKKTLDALFYAASMDGAGSVFLLDEAGNTLYSSDAQAPPPVLTGALSGKTGSWQAQESLYVYTKSAEHPLTFLVRLPQSVVLARLYTISRTIKTAIGVYLLASLFLAIFLAWRRSKPLRELAARLCSGMNQPAQAQTGNEYEFIAQNLLHLIADNESLKFADRDKSAALAGIALEHLLSGTAKPGDQGLEMLRQQGFPAHADRYAAAIIRVYVQSQLDSPEQFPIFDLVHLARQAVGGEPACFIRAIDSQTIALIYGFEELDGVNPESALRQSLLRIDERIAHQCHIHPYLGYGSFFEDLYDLHFSYDQALLAVSSLQEPKSAPYLLGYDALAGQTPLYYYPIDLEYRLINSIKAGQSRETAAILEQLRTENFLQRHLPPTVARLFCQEVAATALKLASQCDLSPDPILTAGQDTRAASERYNALAAQLIGLSQTMHEQKRSHNSVLKERILTYLEENYADAQLCVSLIAQRFNLSESYFSQFFKMQTGEVFSAYLENLRIARARAMIEQAPQVEIETLCRQVGYNNANTFRRAFKRVTGFAPSAYRQYAVKNMPGM